KRKAVISTTQKGKKVKSEGKEKSEWWQYYEVLYDKDEDGNQRKIAKCKYCEIRLVADNGSKIWIFYNRLPIRRIDASGYDILGSSRHGCLVKIGRKYAIFAQVNTTYQE
ncbi:hypothetical protein Tco_1333168, partial [Tanacetum coccineum]